MKICIIGGGNIGTLCAVELAAKGCDVMIYTSRPETWSTTLSVYDAEDRLLWKTDAVRPTSDLASAVCGAEQIWITHPAFLFESLCEKLLPLVLPDQMLLVIPGSGGAEFAFRPLLRKGVVLCGLQRVHSIARLKEKGKSVYMLGRKPSLSLGAIPAAAAPRWAAEMTRLLDIPCAPLTNYLSVTLTPSNPILHTSRLYSMFRDYAPGVTWDHNIGFYVEWTDEASAVMIACDAELRALCKSLPLDLSAVQSLRVYYESDTAEKMTAKLRSIRAFRDIASPMKRTEAGWIPDFDSRYFTADFPFGLKIIRDIGALAGIEMPTINRLWDWYVQTACCPGARCFELTLQTRDELVRIYSDESD